VPAIKATIGAPDMTASNAACCWPLKRALGLRFSYRSNSRLIPMRSYVIVYSVLLLDVFRSVKD
jgi:hypothetical protein